MRVTLRTPTKRDQDEFLRLVRASRALHRPWVAPPSTPTAYRNFLARIRRPAHASFLVRLPPGGTLAGVINFNEIVRGSFQSAYLAYYAFAPHVGRGYMRAGLRLVLRKAFVDLKLHRVEANIQPDNRRSVRLVRSLGFRREGFSPRYLKIGGHWRDHERWALLRDEWRAGTTAGPRRAVIAHRGRRATERREDT